MEEILTKEVKQLTSNYPLRILGRGLSGDYAITEEERPHAHLIGSTGEGKSKFLELLIREDIRRGFGVCLLDATKGAKTLNEILKWCAFNKIEKVCLIDLHQRWQYRKIPGLNPFLYKKEKDGSQTKSRMLQKTSVDSIRDSIRILTNTKDPAQESFINRYLPAVLNCLYNAQSPIAEAQYFSNQGYAQQRREILSYTDANDPDALDLEEAFRNTRQYEHLQTTINRLRYFFREPLNLVFGVDKGIDFMKLVREKWVILVNLDASLDLDATDARLLGTMIINQLVVAIDRLFYKGYAKRYYLYVDEAGEYATRKLASIFALQGKTGLRVTIGHQYFGQFEDKYVIDAINALTKFKAMFNLPGREDRDKITKMFYGGEISDRQASFANADIPKQHAVIKVGKGNAQRVKIPEVKTPPVSKEELESYITKLYENPWYYDPREIQDKLNVNSIYEPLERRQKILALLDLEPRLTASQIANLAYPTKEVRIINGKPYPKSYQSARNMLMRMETRKEVKRQEFDFGVADWFMLPGTKGLQKWAYNHQKAAADLFVAYHPFMSAWSYEPSILKDRADRGMQIFDKTIYFEVDRCTEGLKVIEQKIDNYIRSPERFHVVFAIVGTETEILNRGNLIIPLLQERKRGDQFLIANVGNIISNPLGEIFYSPKDEIKSLEALY